MKKTPSASETPSAKPSKNGLIFVISDDHSGRDEMNLAGNPFALLHSSGKRATGTAHIKYQWNRRLPSGKTVLASWEVNGHAELGLPGPSDEMLYLVLLELTREAVEDGVWPQQVHFFRGALLDRLGWPRTRQYYGLLSDCFARLQAVSIQARHSFYDAGAKSPLALAAFNILDEARIADEPRGRKTQGVLPLSHFKWSDQMYASFTAGNVRSLALDFVLSLDHPTARRLFRYLDMHRNAQKPPLHEYKITLTKLRDHIGLVNLSFASKVKERLLPAHEELMARGYLADVEYRKGSGGSQIIVYRFADGRGEAENTPQSVGRSRAEPVSIAHTAPTLSALSPASLAPAIYPQEAYDVFNALPEAEKERLRELARQDIEPAFWDRLERPDSPMALGLWEIVAREFPDEYAEQLGEADAGASK
ncbi:MAG: replication initiator protein A [Armatimonadetes bacterium]|nr:replication initiator protein A [Armatimonadota bacterium]